MRPLAYHNPPGFGHPLVEPWARAQQPVTAFVYAAYAAESARRPRPWQVPASLPKGKMLAVSPATRRRMHRERAALELAAAQVRELPGAIRRAVLKGETTEKLEEMQLELNAARQAVRGASNTAPRRQRRKAWAEARRGRPVEAWRELWTDHVSRRA